MISASSRLLYGSQQHNPPSRFLSDIDAELVTQESVTLDVEYHNEYSQEVPEVKLDIGQKVRHQIFGVGTVEELDGEVATIRFASRGQKKLNVAFAPLEPL